ncbi:hypothetical protein PRIPAC_96907 [Pristionchus pacificus]|uniref:Uncharacterized protein n=1 Tax=Pristionchus pacificus TaxID=54126 RepID=A0A2A6BCY2_PRIPA|nr:hypothetical protein PRIPAC_96907 [Pristionchus pacificus]|eukprot:PDM63737.1 hypothetical protein PRIPAC_49710 [Pristionchus pacificus]
MDITVFNEKKERIHSGICKIKALKKDGTWMDLTLFSTPRLAGSMKRVMDEEEEREFPNTEIVRPGILNGSKEFWDIILNKGEKLPSGLRSIKTIFGRMITGEGTVAASIQVGEKKKDDEQREILTMARKFFALEGVGITDDPHLDDEEEADDHFRRTVKRDDEGRYYTRLPYKSDNPGVADNMPLCLGQLRSVVKRLTEMSREKRPQRTTREKN